MTHQRRDILTTGDPPPIRDRWTARPAAADDEGNAGALLRQAVRRQPLDSDQLAAIHRRLQEESRGTRPGWRPGGRQRMFRYRVWQVAIGLALVLIGGGLMAAASHYLDWPVLRPAARPVSAPPIRTPAPVVQRTRAAPAPETPAPNVVAPPAIAQALVPARRAPTMRTDSSAATSAQPLAFAASPPPEVSPIAEEAVLLGTALRKLRQDNDPRAALALLDKHGARFATAGALAAEANQTRIEALLRLGQHAPALELLDTLTPAPSGRGRELLATRAELRSRADRCADALADFGALMASPVAAASGDVITERALYGRAGCRARRGDTQGARADLETYLQRFPSGRFADDARAALRPLKGLGDSSHEVK